MNYSNRSSVKSNRSRSRILRLQKRPNNRFVPRPLSYSATAYNATLRDVSYFEISKSTTVLVSGKIVDYYIVPYRNVFEALFKNTNYRQFLGIFRQFKVTKIQAHFQPLLPPTSSYYAAFDLVPLGYLREFPAEATFSTIEDWLTAASAYKLPITKSGGSMSSSWVPTQPSDLGWFPMSYTSAPNSVPLTEIAFGIICDPVDTMTRTDGSGSYWVLGCLTCDVHIQMRGSQNYLRSSSCSRALNLTDYSVCSAADSGLGEHDASMYSPSDSYSENQPSVQLV